MSNLGIPTDYVYSAAATICYLFCFWRHNHSYQIRYTILDLKHSDIAVPQPMNYTKNLETLAIRGFQKTSYTSPELELLYSQF